MSDDDKLSLSTIPVPKGFGRGGKKSLITAELLDRHENLVVNTLKIGQETAKITAWRLYNILKKNKADWEPTDQFMNHLAISSKVTVQLSAEYRQMSKARSAGSVTDDELLEMMEPLLIAILDSMTDKDFEKLLERREALRQELAAADAEIVE